MEELKQKAWMNPDYWLVSPFFLSLFSSIPQDHLPRHGAIHSGPGPPTTITYQENVPKDLPMAQSNGHIFSTDVPCYQMSLACVK